MCLKCQHGAEAAICVCAVIGAGAGGRAWALAKWAQAQKKDGPGQSMHVTQIDLAGVERGSTSMHCWD